MVNPAPFWCGVKLYLKGSLWYYAGMKEQEPKGFDVEEVISRLEASANPTHNHIAESLKELRTPGAYKFFNNSKEPGLIQAARIIRNQKANELLSIVSDFSVKDLTKKEFKQLVNTISKETKEIPSVGIWLTDEQESLALKILEEVPLKTVAAMIILKGGMTGDRIVEVFYPRVFMNLDHSVPPSQKNTLGFAVAAYFLKTVPIK